MTTTDWIIDIVLVLIVVRQIREERLTVRFVLLPLGIVAFVAHKYLGDLQAIPTAGNDLGLVLLAASLGTTLGVAGGLLTRVRAEQGRAYVRAGWAAAGLWIASMGARLGFIIWITHGTGDAALRRFSIEHHITGGTVWQTALVLLALSEVIARMGIIAVRGAVLATRSPSAPTQTPVTV